MEFSFKRDYFSSTFLSEQMVCGGAAECRGRGGWYFLLRETGSYLFECLSDVCRGWEYRGNEGEKCGQAMEVDLVWSIMWVLGINRKREGFSQGRISYSHLLQRLGLAIISL